MVPFFDCCLDAENVLIRKVQHATRLPGHLRACRGVPCLVISDNAKTFESASLYFKDA